MRDFLVLKVLQAIATEENERFLFGRPKEHEAGLLLGCRRRKYLGFLVWTERTWEDVFGKTVNIRYFARCSSSRMNAGKDSHNK